MGLTVRQYDFRHITTYLASNSPCPLLCKRDKDRAVGRVSCAVDTSLSQMGKIRNVTRLVVKSWSDLSATIQPGGLRCAKRVINKFNVVCAQQTDLPPHGALSNTSNDFYNNF
jgi:hypothetical protein